MRRAWRIVPAVLLILAGVAIGVTAYNAGVSHGLAESGRAVQVVREVGPGWFPFGFLIFPLLFFGFFLLLRLSFWRRGWRGHGPGPLGRGPWSEDPKARFEERAREWHRREHEGSTGGRDPGGAATAGV